MTTAQTKLVILNPEGKARAVKQTELARRIDRIEGKTIGVIDDGLSGSDYFMKGIQGLIEKTYPGSKAIYYPKPILSRPSPKEMLEQVANQCDAVIVGIGG
ncbi:MAG: hypothetical protein AAB502_04285 [Chloroflexota bacterium]